MLSKFDAGNVILFQIKVFGRNINATALSRYLIKVTARSSSTRLRVLGQSLNTKIENVLQRFSYISFFFKSPCSIQP